MVMDVLDRHFLSHMSCEVFKCNKSIMKVGVPRSTPIIHTDIQDILSFWQMLDLLNQVCSIAWSIKYIQYVVNEHKLLISVFVFYFLNKFQSVFANFSLHSEFRTTACPTSVLPSIQSTFNMINLVELHHYNLCFLFFKFIISLSYNQIHVT